MSERSRLGVLALLLLSAGLAGCVREEPCPEGVLDGHLIVRNGQYEVQGGFSGDYGPIGTPGNAGIERCRIIRGTVHFVDGLTDFSDFDALEHIMGRLTFSGDGYPTTTLGERQVHVVEGFNNVRRIDGNLAWGNGIIDGLNALESVGGSAQGGVALFSLREVGVDLRPGSLDGSLTHLANLETVGRDLRGAVGDFGSLVSLRSVGRDLRLRYAREVDFTPPVLEEVGRDLIITQNSSVVAVRVPALRRVGGTLRFHSNSGEGASDVSGMARSAFRDVHVEDGAVICWNGGVNDYCPFDPECRDYYGDDYCCDPGEGVESCIEGSGG